MSLIAETAANASILPQPGRPVLPSLPPLPEPLRGPALATERTRQIAPPRMSRSVSRRKRAKLMADRVMGGMG